MPLCYVKSAIGIANNVSTAASGTGIEEIGDIATAVVGKPFPDIDFAGTGIGPVDIVATVTLDGLFKNLVFQHPEGRPGATFGVQNPDPGFQATVEKFALVLAVQPARTPCSIAQWCMWTVDELASGDDRQRTSRNVVIFIGRGVIRGIALNFVVVVSLGLRGPVIPVNAVAIELVYPLGCPASRRGQGKSNADNDQEKIGKD